MILCRKGTFGRCRIAGNGDTDAGGELSSGEIFGRGAVQNARFECSRHPQRFEGEDFLSGIRIPARIAANNLFFI